MPEQPNTLTIDGPAKPGTETEQPTKAAESVPNLEAAIASFGDVFSGRKKKEPAKDDKAETSPVPEKEKAEKDKADVKSDTEKVEPEHKPKPKAKAPQKPALDETRMAEIAAEAGARASTETISRIDAAKEKAKTEKPAEDFKPPKEYAEQYAAFKVMAKAKPDKYGSLTEEFKSFVKEEESYIKQWKRDHPGETWNGEDEQHNEFYLRATPLYDDADFRRAEINLELGETKKEIRREALEEVEPKLKKLDEMERNETLREIQPVIATAERDAMGSILKAIDPAYDKFIDPAELVKLKDEDPVAFDIALAVASDAVPFVAEVTRLWKSKGAVKAQENNPLHQYIHNYATSMMYLIKKLPAEDQLRDGKKFATWNEFNAMAPAQQANYWIVSDQDLIERKLLDAQTIAKERVASEDKKLSSWAKRKGLSNGNANNPAPKPAQEKKQEESKPLPARENNGSPSIGSRTQVSPNAQPSPDSQASHMVDFGKIFNGFKV
jgi:hypothetical protein